MTHCLIALILTFLASGYQCQAAQTMMGVGIAQPQINPTMVTVEQLHVQIPTPGEHEVLIEVFASSVNRLDILWDVLHPTPVWAAAQAYWAAQGAFPKVMGLDVSGRVAAVGSGVTRARVGDEVWAFNAKGCLYDGHTIGGIAGHTWAQFVAVSEDMVGLKPKSLSFAEAGAIPLVGLTSLRALKLAGAPWKGNSTVVILGGTGGTGHVAVQLAKALGATRVVVTASAKNREYVLSLGADQVIDYHTVNWGDEAVIPSGSVDAVYDTVMRPGTGDVAYRKLKSGGHYVGLCSGIPSCGVPEPSWSSAIEHPTLHHHELRCTAGFPGYCVSRAAIDELRDFVEAGKLRPTIAETYPLSQAQDAIDAIRRGHTVGKIAIAVKDQGSQPVAV